MLTTNQIDSHYRAADSRARARGMEYLAQLPKAVPAGRVLVHNHVHPTRRLGSRGFRAWLAAPDAARYERCSCAWAAELGSHHRVRRNGGVS